MRPNSISQVIPRALRAAVLIAMALHSGGASANDSSFGGTGADLVPREETRVSMKSENIVIEYRDESWHITADYVFRNLVDSPASIQ